MKLGTNFSLLDGTKEKKKRVNQSPFKAFEAFGFVLGQHVLVVQSAWYTIARASNQPLQTRLPD